MAADMRTESAGLDRFRRPRHRIARRSSCDLRAERAQAPTATELAAADEGGYRAER